MEKFYSTFEAAKLCHASPGSVIRWIREGKLRAAETAGGHNRISSSDLAEFLKNLRMPVPEELEGGDHSLEISTFKVLIIDDEPGIRGLIRLVLGQLKMKASIEEAADGFQAGWKTHAFHPDLIFLDLNLPNLDGLTLCRFVRSFPELHSSRIIAMAGFPGTEDEEKILQAGANDFISKPLEVDPLKAKILGQIGPEKRRAA